MNENIDNINLGVNNIVVEQDFAYMIEKRDDALEHLNNGIKTYLPNKRIQQRLNLLLRINKQVKLMEDALIVSRITKANKKHNYD